MSIIKTLSVRRLALELAFVLPIALLGIYLPDADLIDRGFFCIYIVASTSIRLWHRKPLEEWGWLVFHVLVAAVLLSELNKLDGYPSGHDADALFLALFTALLMLGAATGILYSGGISGISIFLVLFVITPCIYLVANALRLPSGAFLAGVTLSFIAVRWTKTTKRKMAYLLPGLLAVIVWQVPIIQSAMQASRQVWFTTMPRYEPCVYVTKISDSTVYGVDLRDRFHVIWFDRIGDSNSFIPHSTNIAGLGGGTMEAQSPNISPQVWEWMKSKNCGR